jgi:hypothetical protein
MMDEALQTFKMHFPDWWFTVGTCKLSRHASCGPDISGADAHLLEDKRFQEGFHCDHDGTMAEALLDVMNQGLKAKYDRH